METTANKLDSSRKALLDLSTRNRLINIPQNKQAKVIEIVDEISTEVFRLLVKNEKTLTFLPALDKKKSQDQSKVNLADEEEADFGVLRQPEDDETDDRGIYKRHSDFKLQTLLTSEGLQKRLLSLFYDALTFEEEQGVNILYLALGMLKWFEDDSSSTERYAPLILIPVSLERGSAAEKFKIRWRREDPASNLSLQAKMKLEFGISLPDLPDDEELDLSLYFRSVASAVDGKKRFTVEEDKIILGFFSFAKFLMYRDLDPSNWPENGKLDDHPLITGLIQSGFPAAEGMIHEEANVDDHISLERIFHVVDADSSQTLAIEEVRRGKNLVIQGPPGTGKSQTITNIIASAVKDGKKVLFVAEKMAALEVVQRRMNNIGLGPVCFELHSSKSNKRAVLEELKRTKELAKPKITESNGAITKMREIRQRLNDHCETIHFPQKPSGFSTFEIIGKLVQLKDKGVQANGFILKNPETWSREDLKEKESLLSEVIDKIHDIGSPASNIWVGVTRPQLLPNEYDQLSNELSTLQRSFEQVQLDLKELETIFSIPPSIRALQIGAGVEEVLNNLPECDFPTIASHLWDTGMSQLETLVQTIKKIQTDRDEISQTISEIGLSTDLLSARQNIAMHGQSLFKFMNSKYRSAVALLQSILITPLPKKYNEKLALIDKIILFQQMRKSLEDHKNEGVAAWGKIWQGERSDCEQLEKLLHWHKEIPAHELPANFLTTCASFSSKPLITFNLANRVKDLNERIDRLFSFLQLQLPHAFDGATDLKQINRTTFSQKIYNWSTNLELLSKWISFKRKYDQLCDAGLESIAKALWDQNLEPGVAVDTFSRAYFDALSEISFNNRPLLREFDGDQHNADISMFREYDKFRIEQARVDIRDQHYNTMPRSDGGIGPLGILNGEFAKKRNHLSIRQLIKRSGPAIQALKPIFMMSPLSVAQFLEPGALEFDLLVIDEASQVEPVDALGAVARSKQIVVVGDTRQLPPTRFFSRVTGNISEYDEDDENTTSTEDVESILSLCVARGLPQRMLRWHYRSKHQSLIAVSNKEFYESKLFIVPSPFDSASGMGLKFNYLPHGIFDRGGTSVNQIEAKAVAEAVIKHAKEKPQYSLGVGTFSIKQKQAIIDELEILRRNHPDTEPFFASGHPNEPFFVKNLENIQGDERDVVFISVGYGKNQNGYMAMSFGPIGNDGGERRLNVLISRAKRQCELFASITADDIDLDRGKKPGVAALKLFMKFAQTGKLDFGKDNDREADSLFEEQVANNLRALGYDVKTQIGIAGFFVDLAIVDPERPGRFLLGIECDGASYHSARSARDRDRLRQAVLEDHGWIMHRIWSTDWFRRPKEQLEKILQKIDVAKEILKDREEEIVQNISPNVFEIVTNDTALTVSVLDKKPSVLYNEARFQVPAHIEPHELADGVMADIVTKIVEIESPIHESEIITRVRSLWNLSRAGNRIQSKVKYALLLSTRKGSIKADREFYLYPTGSIQVRDRSIASPSVRKIEMLPPHEIEKAALELLCENFGATREQLICEISRLLGYKSTSSQLKEIIDSQLELLISKEIVSDKENLITLVKLPT